MSPSQKKFLSVSACIAIITTAIAVGGVCARVVYGLSDIEDNKLHIVDHEDRLRGVEGVVVKIHTDVAWIRDAMEREHP